MPVLYQGARKHPLSEIIEKQRREVIDEDYLVIPKEELKRQYEAVRQFDETERLQSRADRNTAFKIDKLIKNLAEAVSSELQQAVKMVEKAEFLETLKKPKRGRPRTEAELEQAKEDLSKESSPRNIISAWNNLVLYIRSFDKVKGIGIRDMKELWIKLTDEVLPNLSSLLVYIESDKSYYSQTEIEQIQLLENFLLQKRLMPISLVSLESREIASERQRKDVNKQSLQLAFDKIDKMLSSKLNEQDLQIIKNLPSNEVFEIERHLIEISHLANSGKPGQEAEADRRLEELIDDIAKKNVVREKAPEVRMETLEAFERRAQKMNEKQLIKNKDDLVKKLFASEDSTMSAELQAKIQVINEIMQERDIIAEGVVELPESIPAPETEKKKRGRPKKKVEEEVEEETFEDMPPLEPADIEEVEFIGEGRNPVIFDDMMNDHYYMLKRLNRK
jgi:hypothetical protein